MLPLLDVIDRAVEQSAAAISLPVMQVRYLFALVAVYPLAVILRLLPSPQSGHASRSWAAAVKHLFSVVVTIGLCTFALGPYSWIHTFITTAISYALLRLLPHGVAHKAVFIVPFPFLLFFFTLFLFLFILFSSISSCNVSSSVWRTCLSGTITIPCRPTYAFVMLLTTCIRTRFWSMGRSRHLWMMYTEWLVWSLNWTTQQMLLTIKLTSCACNIFDGHQPAAVQEVRHQE
jgi:hypothetical protein